MSEPGRESGWERETDNGGLRERRRGREGWWQEGSGGGYTERGGRKIIRVTPGAKSEFTNEMCRRSDADAAGWSQPWFRPSLIECSTLPLGKRHHDQSRTSTRTLSQNTDVMEVSYTVRRRKGSWRNGGSTKPPSSLLSLPYPFPFFFSFFFFLYERTFLLLLRGMNTFPNFLSFSPDSKLRSMV